MTYIQYTYVSYAKPGSLWSYKEIRLLVCMAVYKAVLPEVLSSFTTLIVEFVGQAGYKVLEMGEL